MNDGDKMWQEAAREADMARSNEHFMRRVRAKAATGDLAARLLIFIEDTNNRGDHDLLKILLDSARVSGAIQSPNPVGENDVDGRSAGPRPEERGASPQHRPDAGALTVVTAGETAPIHITEHNPMCASNWGDQCNCHINAFRI